MDRLGPELFIEWAQRGWEFAQVNNDSREQP